MRQTNSSHPFHSPTGLICSHCKCTGLGSALDNVIIGHNVLYYNYSQLMLQCNIYICMIKCVYRCIHSLCRVFKPQELLLGLLRPPQKICGSPWSSIFVWAPSCWCCWALGHRKVNLRLPPLDSWILLSDVVKGSFALIMFDLKSRLQMAQPEPPWRSCWLTLCCKTHCCCSLKPPMFCFSNIQQRKRFKEARLY